MYNHNLVSTLLDKLLNYRNISNGNAYILELSKIYSVEKIIFQLEKMLQSDTLQVFEALFFLRQVSITSRYERSFNEVVENFRKEIPKSRIFSLMEEHLYSTEEEIRSSVIYAFGKMTFPEQKKLLKKAIDFYINQFPLQLGELLFEYFWLNGGVDINLLKVLAKDGNSEVKKGIEWFLDHISDQEKASIKKELGF